MSPYVVELDIRSPIFLPIKERGVLPEPTYYGCRKGYWVVQREKDAYGTERPVGFFLIVELEASDRGTAEDKALGAGLRFCQVVTAYSGSPLALPRLNRLAEVSESEGLIEQFNYYYYLDGVDAQPRAGLLGYGLEKWLSSFGGLDEGTVHRLELAARWYGTSVGAQDSLDGYLAVWIGLESVGPAFSKSVHDGIETTCIICAYPKGEVKDDRGKAGIEHAIRERAPELLHSKTFKQLQKIRDVIAHGTAPAPSVRSDAAKFLPDLQLCLIFAIQQTVRPEDRNLGSGRALARDFKVYPEARAGVKPEAELVLHQPYYEGWLTLERTYSNGTSYVKGDGQYILRGRPGVESEAKVPAGELPIKLNLTFVYFSRLGRVFEDIESDPGLQAVQEVPWWTTPLSTAQERYLSGG